MFNRTFSKINIFQKSMDASWLKNEAITHNLANVNTPGYKRQTVNFDNILKDHLQLGDDVRMNVTHSNHMTVNGPLGLTPQIEEQRDTSFRTDGNNVNVDIEMSELAKNQLKYAALTEQLNGQLTRLKTVIKSNT